MLDLIEAEHVQQIFGATAAQVRRDHAISHVLEALASIRAELIFFGGTALSRTYLTRGRLSEDIDLYSRERQSILGSASIRSNRSAPDASIVRLSNSNPGASP